jgi:tetratricopeptide (TPR) repeat protein
MTTKTTLFLSLILLLLAGCTPKTTEPVVEEEKPVSNTPPPQEEEKLSPCPKFSDAPDPDEAETNYVLYRDFLRAGDWEQSYKLWKKVYAVAPAADGRRNTVFADGIRFYEYFMSQTTDTLKHQAYADTIFSIYDEIDRCYPEGGYIEARKAFDIFYKYPNRASKLETYQMFKSAMDKDGMKTPDFVLNPMASLLVELYDAGEIDQEEAYKYQDLIRNRLTKGLEECKGTACDRWAIIEEYAPVRLEYFETVKGFYDCDYYLEKYYPEFEANPDDCDVVRTVYSRLNFADCPKDNPKFKELIRVGNENCKPEPGPAELAYILLREGKYEESIEAFKKAIEEEENVDKKAQYTLTIAKIYNVHLRNFSRARSWAEKAAELKSGWGEPYILIGRMYASSGPLCGPGRGWDSQIVTWPAIDMWQKAKRVDPSVAGEANEWIGRYSQYMPNKEDVFIRNLKAGQSYYVGCWIQRSTTIRTSD